jgi:hypothetical protein
MSIQLLNNYGISNQASFSPSSISGLQAWFDANDESTITESANAVSQWDDKSGNANHAVQATGIKQPITNSVTINGLNAISFDGVNDTLKTASIGLGSTYSCYFVCKTDKTGFIVNGYMVGLGISGAFDSVGLSGTLSPPVGRPLFFTPSSGIKFYSVALSVGSTNLYKVSRDSTDIAINIDDGTEETATIAVPYTASDIWLGTRPDEFDPVAYSDMEMGEYCLYNKILSANEEDDLINYYNNKWGL